MDLDIVRRELKRIANKLHTEMEMTRREQYEYLKEVEAELIKILGAEYTDNNVEMAIWKLLEERDIERSMVAELMMAVFRAGKARGKADFKRQIANL